MSKSSPLKYTVVPSKAVKVHGVNVMNQRPMGIPSVRVTRGAEVIYPSKGDC